jgi:hypothetical protein
MGLLIIVLTAVGSFAISLSVGFTVAYMFAYLSGKQEKSYGFSTPAEYSPPRGVALGSDIPESVDDSTALRSWKKS